MNEMQKNGTLHGPLEPVLEMNNIQGIVVPGFFKQHQTLLGLTVPAGDAATANFKQLVGRLADCVATARETLDDRRLYRAQRREKKRRYPRSTYELPEDADSSDVAPGVVLVALAISSHGLAKLAPSGAAIPSVAFQLGMAARSPLLGDPSDKASPGYPPNWKVGAPGKELDALLIVAGDHRDPVTSRADELATEATKRGISIAYREDGDVREKPFRGHEHFGFDDGVSQPGIRGRASDARSDFVTERHIAPSVTPESWLFGYPGQDLIWPGEFVLGYPCTSPDPLVPGPDSPATPAWTRDGSFLVFRRLQQDVGLFWRTMRDRAASLSALPGFGATNDEKLAARLVGRWKSGTPFNRDPDGQVPNIGACQFANNYFAFDSDTHAIPFVDGTTDPFPNNMTKADSVGITSPWAAHIRKVNTRDAASDMGSRNSTYDRRLLRVGVPYGKGLEDPYALPQDDPEHGDRGLLFLAIQSSIEDQFEFLNARWVNDDARPKLPGGNDMIIGQNAATPGGVRRCTIFGVGAVEAQLAIDVQWVTATGGGYFFVPSIRTIREVLGARL